MVMALHLSHLDAWYSYEEMIRLQFRMKHHGQKIQNTTGKL